MNLDYLTNISELPVLEDHEFQLLAELDQFFHKRRRVVFDHIDVGL